MPEKTQNPSGDPADVAGSANNPDVRLQNSATLEPEVEELRQELAEMKDRLLRSQAELENFRKRSRRELEDERRYAEINLLRDLMPVLDNAQRALEAGAKADVATLLAGFKLLQQQLEGILAQHNCVAIPALGQPFDPHLHQALMQQPSAEHEANTVIGVGQVGYQLYDRVVRPAQVIVSTKPQS